MKVFFWWIRLYGKHIISVVEALKWARKNNLRLPIKEELSMFKWSSYKRFKETQFISWIQQRPTD